MGVILISSILILVVVGWGYRELAINQEKTKGLTTWMFAFPPFLGLLAGIWFNVSLMVWIKMILILLLISVAWALLFYLYNRSIKSKRSK